MLPIFSQKSKHVASAIGDMRVMVMTNYLVIKICSSMHFVVFVENSFQISSDFCRHLLGNFLVTFKWKRIYYICNISFYIYVTYKWHHNIKIGWKFWTSLWLLNHHIEMLDEAFFYVCSIGFQTPSCMLVLTNCSNRDLCKEGFKLLAICRAAHINLARFGRQLVMS